VLKTILPGNVAAIVLLNFLATMTCGMMLIQERLRSEALRSKHLYSAIVRALPDCLNAKDIAGRFIAANPATAELMQAGDSDALIGKSDFDFYPEETASRFREEELSMIASNEPQTIEQQVVFRDGTARWLSTLKAPLENDLGELIGVITHNRDITSRKLLETELEASQRQLADALSHMADGLVMFDPTGRIILCNEQYRDLFPLTADLRVVGSSHRAILEAAVVRGEAATNPSNTQDWIEGVLRAQTEGSERQIQLADGRWLQARTRPLIDGASISVFSDISAAKRAQEELLAANQRLKVLADKDGLTELLNRRAFDETLEREFKRSQRNNSPISLLLLDIDRFKNYNDRYGHPEGDDCLRAVSRCLRDSLKRPADTPSRYGGEELAAILPDTDAAGAFVIGESIVRAVRSLERPHEASECKIVTVSIGIATSGQSAERTTAKDLLRRADEALYGAKAAGRNRVHDWRPKLVETKAV